MRSARFLTDAAGGLLLGLAIAPFGTAGCGHEATTSAPVERRVRELTLELPIADVSAELSGLAWHGDRLILLPQFPRRLDHVRGDATDTGQEISTRAALLILDHDELIDALDGSAPSLLKPRRLPLEDEGIPDRIVGFDGYEAIAFADDDAYLSIESDVGPMAYLVRGRLEGPDGPLRLLPESLVEVASQSALENFSEEALLTREDEVLSLHEANGPTVNPHPVAHRFDRSLRSLTSLPMAPLTFRISDATALDDEGRFWVIDEFYPGDRTNRYPGPDSLVAAVVGTQNMVVAGEGDLGHGRAGKVVASSRHDEHGRVERLVELRLLDGEIRMVPRPPIYLHLREDGVMRNWEGLARLDDRGFLLVTDHYPRTLLAFVASRR